MDSLRRTVDPATEPVSLSEAKAHLRVTHSDEDAYITKLIAPAREAVEEYLSRSLITQTWEMRTRCFEPVVELPRPPAIAVTGIDYVDTAGDVQTLDPGDYVVDALADPGVLVAAFGTVYPATRNERGAVRITYTAGYGSASAVPSRIKQGILVQIGDLFENRESVVVGTITTRINSLARTLLSGSRFVWHG